MDLTKQYLEGLCERARLELTGEEARRMTARLEGLLAGAEALRDFSPAAVCAVEPCAPESVLREDEVRPSLSRKALLQNAPLADGEAFLVPKTR